MSAPRERLWLGRVLHATAGKLLLALFRVRVLGGERIPKGSGALLAGNHVSYADPTLLWCVSRPLVRFMAKTELFDVPLLGWAVSSVGAFPVRRASADRKAIQTATALLQAGHLVGMFPEGTRVRGSSDLGEAHEGIAFVATRAGVPILPIGIEGTDRIRPEGTRMIRFPRVTISVGEPVDPADFAHLDKRERLAAVTSRVMEGISAELARAKGE